MISVAANPTADARNWNLDSDRGYGYKAWEGIVPSPQEKEVKDEEFTDE